MDTDNKKQFEKFLWGFLVFAVLGFIFWLLKPVFALLGGSIGLSYLLIPAVRFFTSRGFTKETAIGIVFTIIGLFGCIVVFYIMPPFFTLIQQVPEKLPERLHELQDSLAPTLLSIENRFGIQIPLDVKSIQGKLPELYEPAIKMLSKNGSEIAKGLLTQGMGLVVTFVNLSLLPIFCFYFMRDWEEYGKSLIELIPPIFHKILFAIYKEVDVRLNAFVRGQLIVCSLMAILYSIGLMISGIEAGLSIGTLAGILFIIPYFGTAVGIILGLISALITYGFGIHMIYVLLVFGIVQTLESWLFTPYIVGDSVGLSPVVVMLSLLIGASILGLWGIALAIPVTAILSVLSDKLLGAYTASPIYKGETAFLQYIKQLEKIILQEQQTLPSSRSTGGMSQPQTVVDSQSSTKSQSEPSQSTVDQTSKQDDQ